jgi:hypothetical protein
MSSAKKHLPVDEIIRRYHSGESTYAIAAGLGASQAAIHYLLVRHNVPRRSLVDSHRIYPLDEAAFDPPLSAEARYWIGMLITDGGITTNANRGTPRITLSLKGTDAEHVERFRDFLKTTHPLYYDGVRAVTLQVSSLRLTQALAYYGVVPRKSHCARVRDLENDPHFWRGVIDGDGCLGFNKQGGKLYPRLGLCGAQPLLNQFVSFTAAFLGRRVNVHPRSTIFQMYFHSHEAVQVVSRLYDNCPIALSRKLAVAREIMMYFHC